VNSLKEYESLVVTVKITALDVKLGNPPAGGFGVLIVADGDGGQSVTDPDNTEYVPGEHTLQIDCIVID